MNNKISALLLPIIILGQCGFGIITVREVNFVYTAPQNYSNIITKL